MKKSYHTLFFSSLSLAVLISACTSGKGDSKAEIENARLVKKDTSITELKFTIEEAPEWTALFHRTSGWFGADGIFAIPQNGREISSSDQESETLLLFSDTLIGEIEEDSLPNGFTMINNSVAALQGLAPKEENLVFHWDKKPDGKPAAIFVPNTPNSKPEDYFWLGDGFVNQALDNATYLFAYRIRNIKSDGPYNFEEVGNVLIKIPAGSKPPFRNQQQMDTPFYIRGEAPGTMGSLGAGIFVNTEGAGAPQPDGYVYVYGVQGRKKNLIVARVLPEDFEQFDKWRYWDGSTWNPDISKIAGLTDKASNELSLSPLPDGRYALVFQVGTVGTTVGMRIAHSPVGPFGPIIKLWDTSEALVGENFYSYNAKAHPSLSKPGELLISYNVNSFDFFNDIKDHPNLYRPRFIRVKLKE